MKIKMLTIYSRILSFFLVLLGFTSCEKDEPMAEYGTPHAKFHIKGIVVNEDSESSTPIKGIKVVIARSYEKDNGETFLHHTDSLKTDNNGYFNITTVNFPSSQEFVVKFEDVDRAENGLFETKTDIVCFENSTFENGNGWYKGETNKDLGIIKITPKKAEE